jgi:hypothetical protein
VFCWNSSILERFVFIEANQVVVGGDVHKSLEGKLLEYVQAVRPT